MDREEWKIAICGKSGVGRTTMLYRLMQGDFLQKIDPDTYGRPCNKFIEIDGTGCIYNIVILTPAELIQTNPHYDALMLAYSSTDKLSFDEISEFIAKINTMEEIPTILIETKSDLDAERQVTRQEGQHIASLNQIEFFSTSSRTGHSSDEVLRELIRNLRQKKEELILIKKKGKKPIPHSKISIPVFTSTLFYDIDSYLFNNPVYSDLTLRVQNLQIYLHKAVLFARFPTLMEKIKAEDKVIEEPSMPYHVVRGVFKYIYTGVFTRLNMPHRQPGASDEEYKAVIAKWEVYSLLSLLNNETVDKPSLIFENLFNLNFLSDLKIIVENKKKSSEIFCHKMILGARSEYFRAMFEKGFKESNAAELRINDCSYEAILLLLKYYYLDVIEIEDESVVMDLLKVADRYHQLQVLQMISRYLISKISIESVCYILGLCDLFKLSPELKQVIQIACIEFTSYRFSKVAKTSGFKQLNAATRAALEASQVSGKWYIQKEKQDTAASLVKLIKRLTL